MPTRNREKLKAYWAVKKAVETGRLPPASSMVCDYCQEALATGYHHHKGYSKEYRLDVMAACYNCHASLTPYTVARAVKAKETIRANGGFKQTEEAKRKIGESSRNRVRTEEWKQKTREAVLESWRRRKAGESATIS